jgi:3-hydroxymyristoyl/3-hydroxydecanoyl-(acyl carrier protein) dehydratase
MQLQYAVSGEIMRFFLIDKIIEWKPGERASAVKNVALSEDFFDDHFPRMPIMPGMLILEGMAQLGGILLEETVKKELGISDKAIMTMIDKTKFRATTRPGDQLIYEAVISGFNDMGGRVSVMAKKAGKPVVSTTFTFAFQAIDDAYLLRDRQRLLDLWLGSLDNG